jgi:hypothetical protein
MDGVLTREHQSMSTKRKAKKYKPVPIPLEREFSINMERMEGEPDSVAMVTLDLRRLIPAKDQDHYYEHQRAVIKAAEQIHARMLVMGREKKLWHELDIDTYDSYCIAAYNALNVALQCGITFVPDES